MIELRKASEADAQVLSELGRATFIATFADDNRPEDIDAYVTETFSSEKQLKEIRDPNRFIEIAWVENQPAGFLHLLNGKVEPSIAGEKPIEILRLYVDSRWHGKGVGAALMDRCFKIASDQGFKTLWLGVWERNFRAQAFYKKYDFSTVGSHMFRLGSDEQVDLLMAHSI